MSRQVFGFFGGAVLAVVLAGVAPGLAVAQTAENNEAQITVTVTPLDGTDFATGTLEHNVPITYYASIQDADGLPDPLVVTWTWRDATSPDAFVVPGAVTGGQFLTHSLTIAGEGAGTTDTVITSASSWTLPIVSSSIGRDLISLNVALELCVSFTDSASNAEKGCMHTTSGTQNTINDPATGRPSLIRNASGTSSGTLTAVAGAVTQGWNLSVNTTHGATNVHSITGNIVPNPSLARPAWATSDLDDPDRLPVGRSTGDFRFSWQRASSADGPWTEVHTHTNVAGSGAGYTTTQADVDAGWLRACVFYEDRAEFEEGGDDTDATTRAASATLCTTARSVTNVNDLPTTAEGGRIYVSVDYNAANPYFFTAEDFGFADADPGDSLASVEITTLPPKNAAVSNLAAFRLGSDTVTAGLDVSLAQIPTLSYYRPTTGAGAGPGYDRFTYKVTDNNGGESAAAGTIEIDLVETNAPARGAPAVIAETSGETAYNEDITLAMSITDSSHSVVDVDGIDTTSLTYQWQFAMPLADDPAAIPPPDAYQDLFGSTNATYTPTQQRVGQYIRGCISFTDSDGNAEGPLCSVPPLPISNTNDAPTSANADITVSTDFHSRRQLGVLSNSRRRTFRSATATPMAATVWPRSSLCPCPRPAPLYVDECSHDRGRRGARQQMSGPRSPSALPVMTVPLWCHRLINLRHLHLQGGGRWQRWHRQHPERNPHHDHKCGAGFAVSGHRCPGSDSHHQQPDRLQRGCGVDRQLRGHRPRRSGLTVPVINDGTIITVASTIDWQWQQADPFRRFWTCPWSDIAGATATGTTSTFTPTQAQVGKHVRACASFTDERWPCRGAALQCAAIGHCQCQ